MAGRRRSLSAASQKATGSRTRSREVACARVASHTAHPRRLPHCRALTVPLPSRSVAGKAEIHRMWAGSDRNKDIVKAGLSNKDTGEGINWDDYDEQKAAHTNEEWGLTGTAAWTAAHVKAWREEQMAAGSKKRGGAYALLPSSRSPEHAMEWLREQRTLGILRPSPLVGVQPWPQVEATLLNGRTVP